MKTVIFRVSTTQGSFLSWLLRSGRVKGLERPTIAPMARYLRIDLAASQDVLSGPGAWARCDKAISFKVAQRTPRLIEAIGQCRESAVKGHFDTLIKKIFSRWASATLIAEAERWDRVPTTRQGGVALNTEIRAHKFRELKEKNPAWSQYKVAMEAAEMLQDPSITENTVRNCYRAMGWTWDRGDRTR